MRDSIWSERANGVYAGREVGRLHELVRLEGWWLDPFTRDRVRAAAYRVMAAWQRGDAVHDHPDFSDFASFMLVVSQLLSLFPVPKAEGGNCAS